MDGDERRRFCASCRQHVHDLSAVTESEAKEILDRPGVCVRATVDGFGRVLHRGAVAAGALALSVPAFASASTAPVAAEPGLVSRVRAFVSGWLGDEEVEVAPEAPAESPATPPPPEAPPEPAPEQVRHVLMGKPTAPRPSPTSLPQSSPLLPTEAELELLVGSPWTSVEVSCSDGYRGRAPVVSGRAWVTLGAGDCRYAWKGGPPSTGELHAGDHLVCSVEAGCEVK